MGGLHTGMYHPYRAVRAVLSSGDKKNGPPKCYSQVLAFCRNFRLYHGDFIELLSGIWGVEMVVAIGREKKMERVCVVQSVHRGPITNDYAVTGTTFAPEGMIFDSAGMQGRGGGRGGGVGEEVVRGLRKWGLYP
ncbi:hypothetical protein BHE74_00052624 [Ensete ventricosum]|nr:hypothetical protein BHE74_00052624 [Ensete ventricosum]